MSATGFDYIDFYETVAEQDPLHLDGLLATLPELNSNLESKPLVVALEQATQVIAAPNNLNESTALACLRDMDFLMGSLLMQGIDPISAVEGLDQTLVELGIVAGTVPRGTVYTYTVANPDNSRQRSFTDSNEETVFINSVRDGALSLDKGLATIGVANYEQSEGLVDGFRELSMSMNVMLESMLRVRSAVPATFFTHRLRPFFDPVVIDGVSYAGAGGAQLQFVAIDYLLWGQKERSGEYADYFDDNMRYLMPHHRSILNKFFDRNKVCVVDWVDVGDEQITSQIRPYAIEVMKLMRKFRYPHRGVARDNFKLRSPDAVGSGQYSVGALDLLIEKTNKAIKILEGDNYEQV